MEEQLCREFYFPPTARGFFRLPDGPYRWRNRDFAARSGSGWDRSRVFQDILWCTVPPGYDSRLAGKVGSGGAARPAIQLPARWQDRFRYLPYTMQPLVPGATGT